MTKTITINVPKPGDKLPFVVSEWDDGVKLVYADLSYPEARAALRVYGYSYMEEMADGFVDACAKIFGIPLVLPADNGVVAEVSE